MGSIFVRQVSSGYVAQNPDAGAAVQTKFLDLNPPEVFESGDFNECATGYISIAALASDVSLSMGTVALGKMLILKPEADIGVKLVNSLGESQLLTFKAGKRSIIHAEFTGIKVSNAGSTPAKGSYCIVGD